MYLGLNNPTTSAFEYLTVDCTQAVNVSFTMDISTLACGTVFTVYLVSMLQSTSPTDTSVYQLADGSFYVSDTAGTVDGTTVPSLVATLQNVKATTSPVTNPDPQWGVGYRDAQSSVCGGSIELDILECTSSGAATTTHGILNATTSPPQYDTGGSWQDVWGSSGYTDTSTGATVFTCAYNANATKPPYGPGDSFQINTLLPIDVSCSINGTNPASLTMVTTLTQGSNSVTLAPQNIQGFSSSTAVSMLQSMNVVVALWVTANTSPTTTASSQTSWWLDGTCPSNSSDIRSYAQCTASSDTANVLNYVDVPSHNQFYSSYASPAAYAVNYADVALSQQYGPIFGQLTNFTVSLPTIPSGASDGLYWTMDALYRGISTPSGVANWHGAYGNAYGVATSTGGTFAQYSANAVSPSLWQSNVISLISSTQTTQFAELSGFGQTDSTLLDAQKNDPPIYSTPLSAYNTLFDGSCTVGTNQTSEAISKNTTTAAS